MNQKIVNTYAGHVQNRVWSFISDRNPVAGKRLMTDFLAMDKDRFMEHLEAVGETNHGKTFDKLILEYGPVQMGGSLHKGIPAQFQHHMQEMQWDHPTQKGISHCSVEYANESTYDYLVVNFIKPPSRGSMYDHALKEWGELVKSKVRLVGESGHDHVIAAPLNHIKDFVKCVDHVLDFHNECYSRMSKTKQVERSLIISSHRKVLDYVDIRISSVRRATLY